MFYDRFFKPVFLGCAFLLTFIPAASMAGTLSDYDSQIDAILARSSVSGNTWTVQFQNLSGELTYNSRNATTPLRPASNTKIFTSAGAYGLLGTTYVFQGQSIMSYCKSMNKSSNNAMADDLLKEIGRVERGSATFAAGADAVLDWCVSIGINMTGARMYDGSGLNYDNRFSAAQCVDLLRYMYQNYNTYDDTMAIGCVDGTLSSRFCGTNGSGNVFGKTGTLVNGKTIALSGYMKNPNDGKIYIFSMIATNTGDQAATRNAIDDSVNVIGQSGIPNDLAGGITIDNGAAGYSETGSWTTSNAFGYYGTAGRYAPSGSGSVKATWTPNLTSTRSYEVFAWWVAGTNRATNSTYQITHANGTTNKAVNQSINGGKWNSLGTYSFNSGTAGKIVLTDLAEAGKFVIADAICLVPRAVSVIVDNSSSAFTASSNWITSSYAPGYYGTNYQYRSTEAVGDAATWTASLPSTGSYKVYARWTSGTNRSATAPYIISHAAGSTTVNANQQANNGTWVLLGTYNFNAGANTVKLSCWTTAGYTVIADAVKFDLQ